MRATTAEGRPRRRDDRAMLVDSSALVALVDRDDRTHEAAVEAYRQLVAEGYRFFTTNYLMAETFDLLLSGVGPEVARRFLREARLAVYHVDEEDERKARDLLLKSPGRPALSFTDAVTVVVMARLGVTDAFAVDPGFPTEG